MSPPRPLPPVDESEIEVRRARLTLEQKVALVRGADFWSTVPIPEIGLERMVLSDGPAGVRGPVWDERHPSLSLPSGSAMAASWDPDVARRYGQVCALEARRKGVSVLLGPTINLHRSPLGGRHFECMSEDPWLTAELGAAYIEGVQSMGVAATPKHYVANDSETDRYTVDVRPAERALRELYLLPFERAVEAGAWAVMSAYNAVDGVTMSENELLEAPLSSEWGFDGATVSDWTAVRSLRSVTAAQDLAMPGPAPAWSRLADAIRSGEVDETLLDRKVTRLLRLAARVGALRGVADHSLDLATPRIDGRGFARASAVAGAVLLRNEGDELPWDRSGLASIAVIGQNAVQVRTQGGGSATVLPERVIAPLQGIRDAFPGARVEHRLGCVIDDGIAPFPLEWMTNPRTGGPGLEATFLDADGEPLQSDDRRASRLVWFGSDAPLRTARRLRLRTALQPDAPAIRIGVATALKAVITVDGRIVFDGQPGGGDPALGASFSFPPSDAVEVVFDGPREIVAEFDLQSARSPLQDALGLTFGTAPPRVDPEALIAEAAEAARTADAAVVVVGTNAQVESEGRDRTSLDLPGQQDSLVAADAAANPRTVVVVNAGAPVRMPWRDDVRAILIGWFGGQEMGAAIGDIISGDAEPGGRLPTTWPAELADAPVSNVTPDDGVLVYDEGIHIGYRSWLREGRVPAYPFGHGLGYTTWSLDRLEVEEAGRAVLAHVGVTNNGTRTGSQVIQLYAERPRSAIERPARWLAGFAKIEADPGETVRTTVRLDRRRFTHWDGEWRVEDGEFVLRAGFSVGQLPVSAALCITGGRA